MYAVRMMDREPVTEHRGSLAIQAVNPHGRFTGSPAAVLPQKQHREEPAKGGDFVCRGHVFRQQGKKIPYRGNRPAGKKIRHQGQ